ncbi:MAG: DUF1572 family protein [Saprospiraceae bacterium]|nr:DUF1572 family protein [Saprospiraceae bacterium]
MPADQQTRNALIAEVLLRLYDESLPRILKCLGQLSEKQIWWRPNESSNSIGNLVLHLCGNVSQWIGSGLGGFPDTRTRQAEFDKREGINREELSQLLTSSMEQIKPVISNLPADELLNKRAVQTFEESGISILIHVTEHFSYHTGQIAYITKMLTDNPLGFYEGIILE